MPHFSLTLDESGNVQQLLRDGQPVQGTALEQHYSVVSGYFRSAQSNLDAMEAATDSKVRRSLGLQSFLMSLTGLEAFANTYFHALALDSGGEQQIIGRIRQSHGSLSRKITDLIALSGLPRLIGQESLIQRVFELTQLRNEIVHPRWEPSTLAVAGVAPIRIEGLVENRQALFEDPLLCREALAWCLLVVARVAQAQGVRNVGSFMFYWTDNYELSLNDILVTLGLTEESEASA
jgi:hypothetical protein